MLQKLLKILHVFGTVGVLGSYAACLVLIAKAPATPLVAHATAMQEIGALNQWLLVPSLALVVVSGLLGIAANRAYMNAGWAWVKAALGIGMFEGTLMTVSGSARQAAELASLAASGQAPAATLAELLHAERGGLWVLLWLSVANIVLGVWRPRFRRVATEVGADAQTD